MMIIVRLSNSIQTQKNLRTSYVLHEALRVITGDRMMFVDLLSHSSLHFLQLYYAIGMFAVWFVKAAWDTQIICDFLRTMVVELPNFRMDAALMFTNANNFKNRKLVLRVL